MRAAHAHFCKPGSASLSSAHACTQVAMAGPINACPNDPQCLHQRAMTARPSHTTPHPTSHIHSQVVVADPLDACVALRGGSAAYKGKVVLAQRGGTEGRKACLFVDKANNIINSGAAACESCFVGGPFEGGPRVVVASDSA